MARTRTLQQLRTEARQRTETENSDFYTTDELNRYLNQSVSKLYGKLVRSKGDDYFRTSSTVTVGPDTSVSVTTWGPPIVAPWTDSTDPAESAFCTATIGTSTVTLFGASPWPFPLTYPYYIHMHGVDGITNEYVEVISANEIDTLTLSAPLVYDFTGDGDNCYLTVGTETPTTTTVVTPHPCTLPTDFFKLLGVDIYINGYWRTLEPLDWSRRGSYYNNLGVWSDSSNIVYSIEGPIIRLFPEPTSSFPVKIWYIPYATVLVEDTDTFDGINGWEHYVVLDTAISMLAKEESDTRPLMAERAEIETLIDELSSTRDEGAPWRMERRYQGVSQMRSNWRGRGR